MFLFWFILGMLFGILMFSFAETVSRRKFRKFVRHQFTDDSWKAALAFFELEDAYFGRSIHSAEEHDGGTDDKPTGWGRFLK